MRLRLVQDLLTAFVASCLLALCAAQAADQSPYSSNMPQTPMNEQVLMISTGGDDPVDLRVTIFRPDGPGPFPSRF